MSTSSTPIIYGKQANSDYIPHKWLLRFLMSSNHLFFKTFQSISSVLLPLLKKFLIHFEGLTFFSHIRRSLLIVFLPLSKGSLRLLYSSIQKVNFAYWSTCSRKETRASGFYWGPTSSLSSSKFYFSWTSHCSFNPYHSHKSSSHPKTSSWPTATIEIRDSSLNNVCEASVKRLCLSNTDKPPTKSWSSTATLEANSSGVLGTREGKIEGSRKKGVRASCSPALAYKFHLGEHH